MKKIFSILSIVTLVGIALLPSGCGQGEKSKGGGHGQEESPSGASFKPGKGVMLTDETSRILGLEIADVTEESLSQTVQLNVQIFSETHRLEDLQMGHTGCDVHGSGFLPLDKAALVQPKQKVKLLTSNQQELEGFVVAVQNQFAHGETEIIVGVTTAGSGLKDGDFVSASISMPNEQTTAVIPSSALLRTAEGSFVYAVNGGAYYRTAVKLGGQASGKIEILDGLYPGDQIVVKPVETLWIIELRATKGGGHSH